MELKEIYTKPLSRH